MDTRQIFLAVGEHDEHTHDCETYSMLLNGKATLEFNNEIISMQPNVKYVVPPNTVHCMKNIGETMVEAECGGGSH